MSIFNDTVKDVRKAAAMACGEVNSANISRTFLERKEEVSSPCTQQLESEVQEDVSRVQPAPNLSQSLRRSQHNRRAPFRYDPCSKHQSHSEDRAPKRGSAPYSDRAAARSRGLHIASNCRLAPSQGRTKDNFVKGEGVGKARDRPRWYQRGHLHVEVEQPIELYYNI
uniref:Uncharacterized protein n=1 Tax=Caenorhabditis japonica TaxID=281687 RepID=A0A8R1I626_CAEJA